MRALAPFFCYTLVILAFCGALPSHPTSRGLLGRRGNGNNPCVNRSDEDCVTHHVKKFASAAFRSPGGVLRYPYLVPGGPYNQSWEWDSLFMGVALRKFGGLPYLVGTMKNFLALTNVTDGEVQGCVTPQGPTGGIYHAKPIIIQAAWLATDRGANANETRNFREWQPAMEALLAYWGRAPNKHAATGLRVWHDQLQSGSDDLVTSACPSKYSFWCWSEKKDAFTLASADLHIFLFREHMAYAKFCREWAADEATDSEALLTKATIHQQEADAILAVMEKYLWSETHGAYAAVNVRTMAVNPARVWVMGMPLWGKLTKNRTRAERLIQNMMQSDMLTPYGFRSTSSLDPRYSNRNEIKPYSNWRGPIWTNANAILLFGLKSYGIEDATQIAQGVVKALADDLRDSGTWHECLSSVDGAGLAAPGFLSWNTLAPTLAADVAAGEDPFAL